MAFRDIVPSRRRGEMTTRGADDPIQTVQRRMNELFDNLWRGSWLGGGWGEATPHVDVTETDKELRVTAELPGVDEKDLDISLSHDALTIRGEKKQEQEDKGQDYYRRECSYGSFVRTIALPAEVDEEHVEAQYRKGVLTVHLPKKAPGQGGRKQIEVKSD